ncbi:serpin family protein [Streptomyces sp. NPDC090025]|uniref:serpin family protein n=1 Tax=Streptomyces sp. NPDC090025 TaxID=3365922 RepID=UPI00383947E1
MTARWAATLGPGGDTVLSATGLWPLLGLLADAAAGPARDELADALRVPADRAPELARELLAHLARVPRVGSALGLWVRPRVALREEWAAGLPEATLGVLGPDPAESGRRLDAWAAERTGGLIPAVPVEVGARTELVLASAQAVRTTWLRPFEESVMFPERGPWAAPDDDMRPLRSLRRRTAVLDRVGVAETGIGPLTVLKVLGGTGVDVHLLLGPEDADRSAVLTSGLAVLAGRHPLVPGTLLPLGEPGPGLSVALARSSDREPSLSVTTSPFALAAEHDLTGLAEVFGLSTAMDASRGHFPGVADDPPLAVDDARQTAVARFDAKGFEAGSVTAVAMMAAGIPARPYTVRHVGLDIDRPFGFLTVHRSSRLVLTAGWVAEPVPYVDEDEDEDEDTLHA